MKTFISKRWTVLFAVTVMLVCAVFMATGVSAETEGDFEYTIILGDVSIEKYLGNDSEIVIPATIGGYRVFSVGYELFYGNTTITKVTVSEGVASIGTRAFMDCTNLAVIELPDSLENVGFKAFHNTAYYNDQSNWEDNDPLSALYCDGVLLDTKSSIPEHYTVKDGTRILADSAFLESHVNSVVLPKSLETIGWCAFEKCKDLESITLPKNLKCICSDAFSGCAALKTVYYGGTASQWSGIDIREYENDYLLEANRVYNYDPYCSHEYTNKCDTTCNACNYTRTITHTYSNKCDKSCNICGYNRTITHSYAAATCTSAKTCTVCGTKSGSKLGHKYTNSCDNTCNRCSVKRTIKHSYNNACDKTCNVCGYKRTVPAHKYTNKCDTTCNVCYYKRTTAHTYKTTTTRATLSKNGSIVKKCTVCEYVQSKTAVKNVKTVSIAKVKYAYDGKVKTPAVTVKDSAGKTLKKGTDYTVTYSSGRKNVGTYKVTVKLIGKYSGTKSISFTVLPTVKTAVTVVKGVTVSIGAKSNVKVTYVSSDKSVATVNGKGVITGIKKGTATVTVKSGKVIAKVTVNVTNPSVDITASSNSVYRGNTLKLKASTTPAGAKVTWTVNNKSVATVSSNGVVKGVKYGTVTVTAKITYKGKTYTDTYKIKVKTLEPDFKIFIRSRDDNSNLYGATFYNNGAKAVTILARGEVQNNKNKESFTGFYNMETDEISVASEEELTYLYTMEDDISFSTSHPVYAYIYFEYDGALYKAECRSDISGLNKCYKVSQVKS